VLVGMDQAKQYLETDPAAAAEHFAKDIQELLGLARTLRDQVVEATVELNPDR
jgi:hypothetical protein